MVIKNKAPGGLPPGARVSVSHSLKNTHFQAAILLIFLAHSAIFCGFLHHLPQNTAVTSVLPAHLNVVLRRIRCQSYKSSNESQ
jgi:hypothetical protein